MLRRARKAVPATDPELRKAERKAQRELRKYIEKEHGRQKQLAADTGIQATFLSRLMNRENQVIAMENAVLIDLATKGELKAEMLCPSRADVIQRFLQSRNNQK